MGEVNDILCNYFSIPEVFADFWNGTLFEGEQVLQGKSLYKHDKEYYKSSRKVKQEKKSTQKATSIRRDVTMRYCEQVEIILGMELLDSVDYTIAVRLMDYDVQELKRQLQEISYHNREKSSRKKREAQNDSAIKQTWRNSGEFLYGVKRKDRLTPVISVALYLGKESYNGPKDVRDFFKKPVMTSRWQEWMNNYSTNIFELRKLKEKNYQTGLRELIGLFKRSGSKEAMLKYFERNRERFRRLDECTIAAIGVLIGLDTLDLYTQEGEGFDLCKAFEDAIAEGRAEGRAEGAFNALSDLVRDGLLCLGEAAKRLNMTEEAFRAKMHA